MGILERLGLPEAPRIVFASPPLALVICQVRFPRVLSVADEAAVAPFQRALQERYPRLDEVKEALVAVGAGDGPVTAQTSPRRWQFSDLEGNWSVVLAQDFLAIETRGYRRFEQFLDRLREVLVALATHVRPVAVSRIGLRYVNEIRIDDSDWATILRPELLGLLAGTPLAKHLAMSVREETMDFGEGQLLQIRHGLLTGTTVQPRPGEQAPSTPFYLLDLDASRTFQRPSVTEMTAGAICRYVDEYHSALHQLFRWATTEEFITRLGVRADVG